MHHMTFMLQIIDCALAVIDASTPGDTSLLETGAANTLSHQGDPAMYHVLSSSSFYPMRSCDGTIACCCYQTTRTINEDVLRRGCPHFLLATPPLGNATRCPSTSDSTATTRRTKKRRNELDGKNRRQRQKEHQGKED